MTRKLTILALALLLAMPAASWGKDMTGKWGLGFYSTEAPVGARIWASKNIGIDLGVGFASRQVDTAAAPGSDLVSLMDYHFEVGLLYNAIEFDMTNFFVRAGVLYRSQQTLLGASKERGTAIDIPIHLGVEHFFSERFSLSAGHGFKIKMTNPAGEENATGKSSTEFYSDALSIVDIGFHFYFK